MQGFIRGGLEFPPPPATIFPPRNFEIEHGFFISYLHVTEHKYVSSKCFEILSQIVSETIWEDVNWKIVLGGMAPDPPK